MKNTYQYSYKAAREQRTIARGVQPANVFPQSIVQKSGQNWRTGVNKGSAHNEEKVKPRQEKEKPEREINQYNNLNLKELQNELRIKESELNSLKYRLNTNKKIIERTELQRQILKTNELTNQSQASTSKAENSQQQKQNNVLENETKRTPTKQDKQNLQSVDDPMISKLKEKNGITIEDENSLGDDDYGL